MKFGSVCSGIEAASFAFKSVDITPCWFSEIEAFPSAVLKHHYPSVNNCGDMNNLPDLIRTEQIEAPDILCGGTPCQAFSLAGLKEGLSDERGLLTLKFIDIANSIDEIRIKKGFDKSIIMWENVEGVLNDRTNAFGSFLAGLCGLNEVIEVKKWSKAGLIYGKTRNVAWRVLDSKFFGLPQQRKRLYVIATDIKLNPELILFEKCDNKKALELSNLNNIYSNRSKNENLFNKNENDEIFLKLNDDTFEFFREYTDCLYSAYGTKWNGNAAAYNGSLFISHNEKVRRLTPLECERLMGFPDNYTNVANASDTSRYKAIGNSWSIPTVEWIAKQITRKSNHNQTWIDKLNTTIDSKDFMLYMFDKELIKIDTNTFINTSLSSNDIKKGSIKNIIDEKPSSNLFISAKASAGMLRRKSEKNLNMHYKLEILLHQQSTYEILT